MHANSTCHSSRNQSIHITGDSHGRALTLALDQRLSGNTDGLYRNVKYHHIHTRYYNPGDVMVPGVAAKLEYDLTRRGDDSLAPTDAEPTNIASDSSEVPAGSEQDPTLKLPPASEPTPPSDPFQSLSSTEVEYNYLEHLNLLTDPASYRTFDNNLQASRTELALLKYSSLVFNVGHWPASGPWAGGHFTLERYTDLLESAASFLDTIQIRRKIHGKQPLRVIWMGVYAFTINPDPLNMQAQGHDWRVNYRLKVWDAYAERVWRRRTGVARLNGFAQTLAWTQESPDRAHYHTTPAIEATVDEVLHKLNVCAQ
ncbi:hypothetical protein HDU98_001802 [Podochytrium sp. JEL0797]|nr:hypothetical protein HDU98_001802 [Podochytrium sp. JEL0797]